jgi:hypothetical protein
MRVFVILLAFLPFLVRAETTFSSGEDRVALVELFTSEGCSSCPPADRWLSGLLDDAGLWKKFVPVGWHVDYWDGLGWPDPFSKKQFTLRQRVYAREWRETVVYTPAVVLNGKPWPNWRAGKAPVSDGRNVGVLEASVSEQGLVRAKFHPANPGSEKLSLTAAVLVSGISSRVRSGENRGRSLRHDFTVVESQSVDLADGQGTIRLRIPHEKSGRLAIAAWVTRGDSQVPIQATGGWIEAE